MKNILSLDHKKIKALQEARVYISSRKERYICNALARVVDKEPSLKITVILLKKYIQEQLDGYISLENWLFHKRKVYPKGISHLETYSSVFTGILQATRLAWIDWMIEQLQGKTK